jgi:hypothetical protein
MGRNALNDFGQQITRRRTANVTQTEDAECCFHVLQAGARLDSLGHRRLWLSLTGDDLPYAFMGNSESLRQRQGSHPHPGATRRPVAAHRDAEEKRHGDFLDSGRDFGDDP